MMEREDVVSVFEEADEALSHDDIVDRLYDGEKYCSCCGKVLNDYKEVRESVVDINSKLVREGKLVTTPNWNFEWVGDG